MYESLTASAGSGTGTGAVIGPGYGVERMQGGNCRHEFMLGTWVGWIRMGGGARMQVGLGIGVGVMGPINDCFILITP